MTAKKTVLRKQLSPKPIIVFDLDDTLLQMTPAFLAFCKKKYGTQLQLSQITGDLHKHMRISREEELKRWFAFMYQSTYLAIKPRVGVKRTLFKLRKSYSIILLTNREHQYWKAAKQWLNKHLRGCYDKLIFARDKKDRRVPKGELCRKLGAIVLVDDEPENIYSAQKYGIQTILFDQPWNKRVSKKVSRIRSIVNIPHILSRL